MILITLYPWFYDVFVRYHVIIWKWYSKHMPPNLILWDKQFPLEMVKLWSIDTDCFKRGIQKLKALCDSLFSNNADELITAYNNDLSSLVAKHLLSDTRVPAMWGFFNFIQILKKTFHMWQIFRRRCLHSLSTY